MIIVGPLFLVIIVFVVLSAASANRSVKLKRAVAALGNVTQFDYQTIVSRLGNPASISGMPNGEQLVQWITPRYHIAMSFDRDGKCLGIDHEAAA
jgi:hypothetical protein